MNAIVADTASVIQETKEMIKKQGLEERCRAVECNFFQNIPKGPNAYLFSNILHDWSDDQCRIILSNCRKAMKKDARLLVVEMVVPYGNQPCVSKLLDLEMFVMTGGRERTQSEFEALFKSSGFTLSQIIPANENVCLLEGLKQ